jgi:hypothetical protein
LVRQERHGHTIRAGARRVFLTGHPIRLRGGREPALRETGGQGLLLLN